MSPLGKRTRFLATAAAIGFVLSVTLPPVRDPAAAGYVLCVLCGDLWLADLLANVPFFVPVGAALAWTGLHPLLAVGSAIVLSIGIELAQLVVPGRFSSPADVAANSLGAALGVLLLREVPGLLRLRGPARGRLGALAASLAALLLLAPALLLRPSLPDSTWYPQWAPRLDHLDPWLGEVRDVVMDGRPLPNADPGVTDFLKARLQEGAHLRVEGSGTPPPGRTAPAFAIHDQEKREILLLGQQGEALVFRLRAVASELALRRPSVRVEAALPASRAGTPLQLTARIHAGGAACPGVDDRERCGLEPSVGRGWAHVLPSDPVPPSTLRLLDLAWLGGIGLLAGMWALPGPAAAAVLLLLAGAGGPLVGPVSPLGGGEWLALLTGAGLAAVLNRPRADAPPA